MLNKFLAILFLSFFFLCPSYSQNNNWVSFLSPQQLLEQGYSLHSITLSEGKNVIYHFVLNENIASCVFTLEKDGGLVECYNIANTR
tara:strand:- start:95 stop:355 length:261 start_codon:yes stop_codon:yes gene_type:complete